MCSVLILPNRRYGAKKSTRKNSGILSSFYQMGRNQAKPTLPNTSHRWARLKPHRAVMPGSQPEELESQGPCPLGSRRQREEASLEGDGTLPTSVVAWGHWISPSPQHLRSVSQAVNHIRSWLPAGSNCPTPPEEPAFQDWIFFFF